MKLKLLLALGIVAILVTVTTAGYLIRGYLNAPPESPDDARTTSERVLDDLAAVVGLEETLRSEAEPLPVTVQGRVDLFGACDGDAPVSVYALDRAQDLEAVMRELAREAGALEADAAASEPDHVVARAACDATGAFELTLPDGTRRAHLLAVGAHAYCQETRAVEIEEFGARATLLPYCGARVEGRVLAPTADGTLAPVEGALLHASSLREARSVEARTILRAARSDAEGRFSFDALPLPGDYQVEVRPADFAPAIREVRDLDLGGTATLEFVLTPGAELAGRVVDPAGRGVADAEVTAAVSGGVGRMGYGRRSATTDADGGFRLRALTPTRLMVTAARAGSLDAAPQVVELDEAERREGLLLVLEPGAEVSGRVLRADGAPAADELVRVRFDRARQFARYGSLSGARGNSGEARTDAQGRFLVGGLGKGPFSVTVQAEGDDAAERPRASAHGVAPGTAGLELVLAAPSALTGEVRGEDGAPLEAFTVRAVELMDTELGELARDAREESYPVDGADAAPGAFRLSGLVAGRWTVHAWADGYAPAAPVTLELPRDAGTPLRFDLARAASVRGLVLSPGGAPIAGAAVTLTTGGPSWRAAAAGEPPAPRALTAEDGGFELVGVAPGERFLVASAEGFAGSEPARLALAPGEQRTDVELALREGGVLSGEVYGRDGAPAAGAVVQLVSSPAFDVILGRTDERGRFAFEHLAAGTWQVLGLPAAERMQSIASNQGDSESTLMGEMTVAIVEVRDGDAEHVVLGAPPTEPLHLTGRVLAGDRGLPAAVLGFFKEGRDVAASTTRAATDEDGRFAIVLDGPGRYVVAIVRNLGGALGESQLELPLVLGAGDAQDVVLALPTGSVSGVLLDAAGAPAPDTRVTLSESGPSATDLLNSRHHTQTRSDAEGRFRFDFVPGGEYLLAAGGMVSGGLFEHSAAFGRVVLHVDVPEGAAVEVPPLALDAPVSGRVRVVDGNGRPVKGAAVFARGADGQLVECTALLTSDDAGQCEYRGLVPGAYTFSARWRDLASSESAPVDLRGGASDEVVLELQEATELVVQLRDGDGRPTAGLVTLLDDQGRELQRMTSLHEVLRASDGTLFDTSELRLGPLPPGRYRVEATDGVHSDRRPLTLDGRTERKLTLRLR